MTRYTPEMRERAVRMLVEARGDHPALHVGGAACGGVGGIVEDILGRNEKNERLKYYLLLY